MPKNKRGHHRTKRRTKERSCEMRDPLYGKHRQSKPNRKYICPPIENRLPLEGINIYDLDGGGVDF